MKTGLIKSPHVQNSPVVTGEPYQAPRINGEPLKPQPPCDALSHINCPVPPIVTQCRPPSKLGCVIGDSYDGGGYSAPQDAGFGIELLFASLIAWVMK